MTMISIHVYINCLKKNIWEYYVILIFGDFSYPHNNAEHTCTKQSKYPLMAVNECKNDIISIYTYVKNRFKSELCLF